jgi:hypothetical protein
MVRNPSRVSLKGQAGEFVGHDLGFDDKPDRLSSVAITVPLQ